MEIYNTFSMNLKQFENILCVHLVIFAICFEIILIQFGNQRQICIFLSDNFYLFTIPKTTLSFAQLLQKSFYCFDKRVKI